MASVLSGFFLSALRRDILCDFLTHKGLLWILCRASRTVVRKLLAFTSYLKRSKPKSQILQEFSSQSRDKLCSWSLLLQQAKAEVHMWTYLSWEPTAEFSLTHTKQFRFFKHWLLIWQPPSPPPNSICSQTLFPSNSVLSGAMVHYAWECWVGMYQWNSRDDQSQRLESRRSHFRLPLWQAEDSVLEIWQRFTQIVTKTKWYKHLWSDGACCLHTTTISQWSLLKCFTGG